MPFQNNSNIIVAIKRETVTGTAATAAGATRVRLIGSSGLERKRAIIQSVEKRGDGLTSMGRLGGVSVSGGYSGEMSIGGAVDIMTEAIMRSTWVTATAIGFATMTTVAIGSNTVTAAGGDWIATQGLRVGDIFTLSGTSLAADNNVVAPIIALGTLTITTVTGAFTTLAATATGTITIAKRVVSASVPTRYSHTVEQYDEDTDLSELFIGCRLTGWKLSLKPGAMAMWQATFMGMDRTILTTGTSPWFTTPTNTTGLELISDDATLRKNGVTVTTFTSLDIDFSVKAQAPDVIGTFIPPDVFDNDLVVSGSAAGLRQDFANLTLFDAETEFELWIILRDTSQTPNTFYSVFLPRVKITGLAAPVGGGDGAKIETIGLMVGPKVAATGYDGTIAVISSSAP